jgi:ribosomal protein L11 methyltransferase
MFSLALECTPEEAGFLIASLWEAGSAGITELPGGLCAFFDRADEALAAQFAAHHPQWTPVEDRDWIAASQAAWTPFPVGERFFLVPQWRDDPAPEGRVRIPINPGLACGSGFHEATQLCLEAIEALRPHETLLDVGTGSGILSVAAGLLGARRVIACDDDPTAVSIARSNFSAAALDVLLFLGSSDAVRGASVDAIVCNIGAQAAIQLAPSLVRALRPGGIAFLSGFESSEQAAVEASVAAAGAAVSARRRKNDWVLLEIRAAKA